MKNKGFSKEDFKFFENSILKYTQNFNRFDFVKKQYDWLKLSQKIIPENSFSYLKLIKFNDICGYFMEFIKDEEPKNENDVLSILTAVKQLKNYDYMFEKISYFFTYINYIDKVINDNKDYFENFNIEKYIYLLSKYIKIADKNISFAHGDLTTDNIVKSKNKLILIDPNFRTDIWSSYLLDIAKLYQETFFTKHELQKQIEKNAKEIFNLNKDELMLINLLHISHYIRMIPYLKDKPEILKDRLVNLKYLEELFII